MSWPLRAEVSKPTVVRFCRSVGYDGLADFKLKLAGSVNEGVPFVHRAVDEDDKAADILVKVIDNAVSALLKYRNHAAGARRASARSRPWRGPAATGGASSSTVSATRASSRRTHSTSSFASACAASAVSDGHVQVMSATMLQPGDCAVIISNSGRSRDLLDAAEIARRKGATTIVITASGSPLAHASNGSQHVLLAADHPEDYDRYSPMVSRLLHLVIIDVLTTGVALRLGGGLRPMLDEIKRNLRAKRYAKAE